MNTMTDRELLELAAKACGFELLDCTCKKERKNSVTGKHWNPMNDDGDALRLAVKLGIDIAKAQVDYWDKDSTDPYAATRRAIVMAAAEIGKTK
jgi:hypothetical protein